MGVQYIKIKKALLDWAFELTDLDDERKQAIVDNNSWLNSESKNYLNPTVKQLGNFAQKLHVPFSDLLLESPPEMESIRVAFRTKNNAPSQVSLNVREIIYEMKRKQAWFIEESQYADKTLEYVGISEKQNVQQTTNDLEKYIKLKHFTNARELYADLRDQLAFLGILVMQKGGVGLGTNRSLDITELRAFVLLDNHAPLIFINQKDSYPARIFSLIHEFVHVLRGTDELLDEKNNDVREERLINSVTAAFLMPEEVFRLKYNQAQDIQAVSRYFNVSSAATAIRAKKLNLIQDVEAYTSYYDQNFEAGEKKSKGSGGNAYMNALSLNDRRFMSAVVDSQARGNLQPTKAAALIGISAKMLGKTVEQFNDREATR